MGCCCSKRHAFGGEGHRLGSADEQRADRDARAAAAKARYTDQPQHNEPYTDADLTNDERAQIREERVAAAEGRLTKQQKKEMKQKKKTSNEPLRGPNSQNTMRWTS